MKQPETSTIFAGVDGRAEAQLPEWYARKKSVDEPMSFAEAIRNLPRAVETSVAYRNPHTGDWIATNRFNAIVEPARLQQQAREDEGIDPLFHIRRAPTRSSIP